MKKLCFLLLVLAVSVSMAYTQEDTTVNFYVSTTGNDAWSGKLAAPNSDNTDGPFATVQKAQKAVRALITKGLTEPVTVMLRGGTYRITKPLTFTPKDSGTKKCPITYTNYKDENVIISGGRTITGFKKDKGKLWSVKLPEVKAGEWYFNQLFVNGTRRMRARAPGQNKYLRVYRRLSGTDKTKGFSFEKGDLANYKNAEDATVVLFHCWDASVLPVESIDTKNNIVRFTIDTPWQVGRWTRNQRYYVENVFEGLDEPGEWYLNRKTGMLYYYPLKGEKVTGLEVTAPVPDVTLVSFKGRPAEEEYVQHIHLKNLSIRHANANISPSMTNSRQAESDKEAAIMGVALRNASIVNCEIAHVGEYGIWLREGCRDILVQKCHIHDLGAGGVKIGKGWERDAVPEDNYVTIDNNFIHDGGYQFHAAVGVWIGKSSYNKVTHNEICDFDYTGISLGWSWDYAPTSANHNAIEYNHIHHIFRGVLSDGGGIYSLGISPGTKIRYNLIHDVQSYPLLSSAHGIYTDQASSDMLIENNITCNISHSGFFQHFGKDNIVRNNIFAFSNERPIYYHRSEEHNEFFFTNNIILSNNENIMSGSLQNNNFTMDKNVYYSTKGTDLQFDRGSFSQWQARGHDKNSVIADPLFVDAKKYNFKLKPGSPALKLGFKQIDMSKTGLYGDPSWTGLPKKTKLTGKDESKYYDTAKPKMKTAVPRQKKKAVPAQASGDMVAHYEFNRKKGGIIRDLSGYGNDLSVYKAVSVTRSKNNKSLEFNSRDSYAETAPSESLNITEELTITAWVKPADTWNWIRMIDKSHTKNEVPYSMYSLMFDNKDHARMEVATGGKQNAVHSKSEIPSDTWTHIAGTYDGKKLKLYINGKLEGTEDVTGLIDTNEMPLAIGRSGFDGNYYRGQIDDVRVYKTALNKEQIRIIMQK